jgi:hypothetical protein
MFSRIEEQTEFNEDLTIILRQLAAEGNLKKYQKVSNAIKSTSKDDHETA